MNFFEGFRNKIYFITCPLCKMDKSINCEICFNERRRLFYIPAVPLKSLTVVWAANVTERIIYFEDAKGLFSIELDAIAHKSLMSQVNELEELSNTFVPGNSGKYKNEFVIEMNEIGKE